MRMLSETEHRFFSFQRTYWEAKTNARSYDHPIVSFFAAQRIEHLAGQIDFSEIENAVELGAGDGFATYYMSKVIPRIFASDLSLLMLEKNPLNKGGKVQAAAESLPLADNSVDLSYCWEVLHHVPTVEVVLAEMKRVSSKYVVFFEPNRNHPAQFLFSLLKKSERGGLKFSRAYLRRVCASADLEIIHMATVGCIFPNMTPSWLFPLLKRLAFVKPLTGISNVVVAKKKSVTRTLDT
jgi:SAM-dependent methyltransferase